MVQSFCKKCHQWFRKYEACPECGGYASKFNKTLMAAKLNGHLYAQANRVTKEKTDQAHFVRQAKREQKRVAG